MSKILIIDIETTDFLQRNGKIVEVGIVELDLSNGNRKIIFDSVCWESGLTEEEVKQDIFKKIVNPTTFYEGEFGELIKIERWRSTASLDTAEMTLCINRFRDYASKEAGIYLPEPTDLVLMQEMEIQINNNQNYL